MNPGRGSPAIDTEYALRHRDDADTLKVLTARGNSYSATYPSPASQSIVEPIGDRETWTT